MVLPADRIAAGLLQGPLLRSGQMDEETAESSYRFPAVTSTSLMATPPKVQFLQSKPRRKVSLPRVQKFILRIKDPTALSPLRLT